jgi:hypothetical protein
MGCYCLLHVLKAIEIHTKNAKVVNVSLSENNNKCGFPMGDTFCVERGTYLVTYHV